MANDETNKNTITAKASIFPMTLDDLPPVDTLTIIAGDEKSNNTTTTKAHTFPSTPDILPPVTAYDHTIQVHVGSPPQIFEIHNGLLTFYSSYFSAALSTRWHAPTNRTITLVDESIHLFSIFHTWLYTHRLLSTKNHTSTPLTIQDAIHIWTFGEYYGIPGLQNQAMNLLLTLIIDIWRTFNGAEIDAVYDYAPAGSALRRFVVDFVICTSHADYEDKDEGIFAATTAEEWAPEFLFEVASGFTMRKSDCARWTPEVLGASDWCVYHVHADGVRCRGILTDVL